MKRLLTTLLGIAVTLGLALGIGACTDADGDGITDSEECREGQSDPDGDGRCPQNLTEVVPG